MSAEGNYRSSQNPLKHGLSSVDVLPIDHALKRTPMADAIARGFAALAAEALVNSILQYQYQYQYQYQHQHQSLCDKPLIIGLKNLKRSAVEVGV